MSTSNRPREVDIRARETREKLELAAARGDPALALEAARLFAAQGLSVSIVAADCPTAPRESDSQVRRPDDTGNEVSAGFGRPFAAKYAGFCVLCAEPIARGQLAVYRAADRAIAHTACARGLR